MRLQFSEPPRTGTKFRLSIIEYHLHVHTLWLLDGDVVTTTECDDPPCYEEMYIHQEWEGRELHIVSSDARERKELRFRIEGTNLVPTPATGARQAR